MVALYNLFLGASALLGLALQSAAAPIAQPPLMGTPAPANITMDPYYGAMPIFPNATLHSGKSSMTNATEQLGRRQAGGSLNYELNQRVLDQLAARVSKDVYGGLQMSYTIRYVDSAGGCGTATFFQVIAAEEVAFYVSQQIGWNLVVFQGTVQTNGEDWWDNVQYGQADCWLEGPCGKIHHGFFNELKERSKRFRYLVNLGLPTLVTGHSLGAALATVEALLYKRLGSPEVRVVTFGSPRVGDPEFRDHFYQSGISSASRYVNFYVEFNGETRSDTVTHSPAEVMWRFWNPLWPYLYYSHVGNPILMDVTRPEFLGCLTCPGFQLHSMDLYVAELERRAFKANWC
ncbi:Alpha/Beta hydrolase protein [Hyaloraphidium curvatum]|nr:Alpha/Beta hydrolase protein [Hyaloraphidium curvatum]